MWLTRFRITSIWKNELLFPAYLAFLSAVALGICTLMRSKFVRQLLTRLCSRKGERKEPNDEELVVEPAASPHAETIGDIKTHINFIGGPVIFAYKFLRLVLCIVLLGLTIATLVWERETSVFDENQIASPDAASFTKSEWLQVALALTYVSDDRRQSAFSISYPNHRHTRLSLR